MRNTNNLALLNGLRLLLLYNPSTPLLTVREISKKLGYSQSKTYRLVKTLTNHDFLQKKPGTKQYALGLNIFRLGLTAQQNLGLSVIARPFMEELSRLAKESVFLSIVNGSRRMLVEKVESDEPVRYSSPGVGTVAPLTIGASSKVLLAYLPEEDWDRLISSEGLKKYTSHTITDADQLKRQLKEIRERGYAFSDREELQDVRAVAAPIRDSAGEVVAALGVGGPVYRVNKNRVTELIKMTVKCSQRISESMARSRRKQKLT